MNSVESLLKQLEEERRSYKATLDQKEREVQFLTRMTAEQKATCEGLSQKLQEKDRVITSLEEANARAVVLPPEHIPNAREIIERQQLLLTERKQEVNNSYELNRQLKSLLSGMMESRLAIEGGATTRMITERPSSRQARSPTSVPQLPQPTQLRSETPTPYMTPYVAPASTSTRQVNSVASALTPETQRILEKYRGVTPAASVSQAPPAQPQSQDSRILDLKRQLEEARNNRERLMATLGQRANSRQSSPLPPSKQQ